MTETSAPLPSEDDYGAGPPPDEPPALPANIDMDQPAVPDNGDGLYGHTQEVIEPEAAPAGMVKTKIGFVPEGARGVREPQIKVLDPTTLQDQPVPERRWLVADMLPMRNVTMLSGDGGIGKSIVALQLMAACALGRQWLGKQTRPCKAFGLFCEDDEDEVHRRLADIARHYDAELGDLENLQYTCRDGLENLLMEWKSAWETGDTTWLHAQIMNRALEFGAQIVVLDSLHDIFAANEVSRTLARQFVQCLREIAREINGAVVFTAHPSLTGLNTGTGLSGSTAWNNAVRSRLYLTKADETAPNGDLILKTMKANYARGGGEIRLRWNKGTYEEIAEEGGMIGSIKRGNAETAFLDCLDHMRAEERDVADRSRASNYAPRVFEKRPEATGYDRQALERAMERLFARNVICIETYGARPSRQYNRIIRVEPSEASGGGNA